MMSVVGGIGIRGAAIGGIVTEVKGVRGRDGEVVVVVVVVAVIMMKMEKEKQLFNSRGGEA